MFLTNICSSFVNIELYSAKLPLSHVEPINIKGLGALDLFHFGWNIWNHFRVGKQDEISQFLKQVFAITFKDVEVGSRKSFQNNKNISIGIALILNPRRSLLIWLWQLPYCFVSLVGNYFLWQSKQQYKTMPWNFVSLEYGEVVVLRKSYGLTMCLTFIGQNCNQKY